MTALRTAQAHASREWRGFIATTAADLAFVQAILATTSSPALRAMEQALSLALEQASMYPTPDRERMNAWLTEQRERASDTGAHDGFSLALTHLMRY